ncbi:unnamed protein product, partial [Hapterophycus canaliculatus]
MFNRPLVRLPSSTKSAPTTQASAPTAATAAPHCSRRSQRGGRVVAVASSPSMQQEERVGFDAKVAPTPGDPSEEEAKAAAAVTVVPEVPNSQLTSQGVDMDAISGKRLLLEFKAFGFFKRTCQLELRKNGDSIFSKGMVAKENGAWRVEEEEGLEYLQFSCPLTEMYGLMFDVPSALLFWRVPLRKGSDGSIVLQGGQIISE